MFRVGIKLALIGCALMAMSGCEGRSLQQWLAGAPKAPTATQSIAAAKAAAIAAGTPNLQNLNADTKTDVDATTKYSAVVNQMLIREQFDDLDQLADSLRQSKSTFSGGLWKLFAFYSGVLGQRRVPDADWQVRIERLKQWTALKPDSITAKVALAEAYATSAWDARGTGYTDSVHDDQWKIFEERLALAKQVLDEASHLKVRCPQWYFVMFSVALGQGWSKEQENALLDEAITFEPTYRGYYTKHSNYLKPNWYGEEGDWEDFADQLSRRLGPKQGSIAYYRIAIYMNCCDYDANAIFTKAKLSWEKIKAGCQESEQLYGSSIEDLNDCARLADEADDRLYAKQLFTRIGDNWRPETWHVRQSFNQARSWALSGQ